MDRSDAVGKSCLYFQMFSWKSQNGLNAEKVKMSIQSSQFLLNNLLEYVLLITALTNKTTCCTDAESIKLGSKGETHFK